MSTRVLISGATGKQGGAVIAALLASGKLPPSNIRALTRTTSSPAAVALSSKGIEVVQGSFADRASLVKALTGVSAAFLVTMPDAKGGAKEEEVQGKLFVDAAKEAGVPRIVFTSVEGAERKTGIPHFESKFVIEEYLKASGLNYTIIRPVGFFDNFPRQKGFGSAMTMGLFDAALHGKKVQLVSTTDIGWFAARALESPSDYDGRIIPLASEDLSMNDVAAAYARVAGAAAWKAPLPSIVIRLLPYDFRTMFWWFYSHGYEADIAANRKEHPGMLSFEQWLSSDKA